MSAHPPAAPLDVDELKYLALKAMKSNKDEEAIRLLKEANALSPDNAELIYLLGAMHAQIGMVPRAIEEIAGALALAPDLHGARFQLGLLYFSSRDFTRAKGVWAPLIEKLAE